MRSLLHVLLTSTALASSALATDPYETLRNSIPLTGSGIVSAASAEKLLVGYLSGHGARDLAIRFDNGQVGLFYAPGGLKLALSVLPSGTVATDIAIAGNKTANGHERLVVTDASGFTFWLLSKSGAWSAEALTGPNSSLWVNAKMLRSVDVDSDGDMDVVGIQSNSRSVVMATNNGAGTYTTSTGPVFAQDLSDFAVAQMDADPEVEFIGLQPNGIVIRDVLNNITMFTRTVFSGAGHGLATVHRQGLTDQVVWLTPDSATPGADTRLYVVDQSGLEGPILFSALNPSSISAGDFNQDGLDDLIVGNTSSPECTLLRRLPGTPSFAPASPPPPAGQPPYATKVAFDGAFAPSGPSAEGILADLDGDSIPEAAGFSPGSRQVRVLMRDVPAPPVGQLYTGFCSTGSDALVGMNFDSTDMDPGIQYGYAWTSPNGTLQLMLDEAGWGGFNAVPIKHNAFEVYVYRQLNAGPGSMTLSSNVNGWRMIKAVEANGTRVAKANTIYNTTSIHIPGFVALPDTIHLIEIPLTGLNGVSMPQMDWTGASGTNDFCFYIEVCACMYNSSTGQTTNRGRMYKFGVSGSPYPSGSQPTTTGNLVSLATGQPGGVSVDMNCFAIADSTGVVGGVKIGGAVALSSLPNFQSMPMVWPPIIVSGF